MVYLNYSTIPCTLCPKVAASAEQRQKERHRYRIVFKHLSIRYTTDTIIACSPSLYSTSLPCRVYYYYSIYQGESVNGSADDAYTRMRIGIPARNLCKWTPCKSISIKTYIFCYLPGFAFRKY